MQGSHSRKWHWLLALIILPCLMFSYGFYYYKASGPLEEPKNVLLPRGSKFGQIVDRLSEQGVIHYPLLFKASAVLSGNARRMKAGEYAFLPHVTPQGVIQALAEGKVVIHKLTVPEGLTSEEILELLRKNELLEGDLPAHMDEGILLPETYHYSYGDQRLELLSRMQKSMDETLKDLWAKRDASLPLADMKEAVTLASIVEKETGVKDERGRVAAVFYNRLHQGMKLQSDPTVAYAITQGRGKLDHPLNHDDLAINSDYNTYVKEGLPPGPIANPGKASLKAVLNPPKTDDLFFVATGTGGHNFAKSLKDHNRNINEYRKALKKK